MKKSNLTPIILTKARWVMAGLAVAASTLLCTAATQATAAGDLCKPNVKVTNNKGAAIKVLNFRYKVDGGPETYTESLANKTVSSNGGNEEWPSQRLAHAVLGIVITSTSVEYKDDTGPGFGPPKYSAWFPHTFKCADTHNYIQTIGP